MSGQDKEVFDSLMKCYGKKFLEMHCILIITCGDNFEKEQRETGQTFEEWCSSQDDFFLDLLDQCGNRILLFDNMTRNERKRDSQVRELIEMTERFQLSRGERLTTERFAANFDQTLMVHLNFALIGNTGTGKSRTGNSILKENVFESRGMTTSVTKDIFCNESHYIEGRFIRMVDTPGVCDPEKMTSISSQLQETIRGIMRYCRNGYHAVLLVIRYGVISSQDKKVFNSILECYGERFLEKHCILIITCGDNFEKEQRETGQTFEEWCSSQDDAFRSLISQCGNRILLFDNMTRDERKRDTQVRKLIEMTEHLQQSGGEMLKRKALFDQCSIL